MLDENVFGVTSVVYGIFANIYRYTHRARADQAGLEFLDHQVQKVLLDVL